MATRILGSEVVGCRRIGYAYVLNVLGDERTAGARGPPRPRAGGGRQRNRKKLKVKADESAMRREGREARSRQNRCREKLTEGREPPGGSGGGGDLLTPHGGAALASGAREASEASGRRAAQAHRPARPAVTAAGYSH
ncbi:hypothetical protein EVAR_102414_1 [Eumeta japonica]|uniref:Uncharacterized protein n=1 Tax=Eumeta variegata TaxID=151549 RepID=A0A4C1Z0A2_EUMVA|nr:hypothetical protein EVAR_102414_1 [Eumeta japonica]